MRWLLPLFFAACSAGTITPDAGMDAGTDAGFDAGTDAGSTTDAGNPSRYWDGGTCTVKTDCPCFSNDDCAPDFHCVSEDATGLHVYCLPGARGTGAPGTACTVEGDCASALCVEPSSGPHLCSRLCDVPADCPSSLPRCIYIGFGVDRSVCSPP